MLYFFILFSLVGSLVTPTFIIEPQEIRLQKATASAVAFSVVSDW